PGLHRGARGAAARGATHDALVRDRRGAGLLARGRLPRPDLAGPADRLLSGADPPEMLRARTARRTARAPKVARRSPPRGGCIGRAAAPRRFPRAPRADRTRAARAAG